MKCKEPKSSKKIFLLATGNHEMYNRRRKPDTLEVQQMKAQREGDRKAREKERARLRREQEARYDTLVGALLTVSNYSGSKMVELLGKILWCRKITTISS